LKNTKITIADISNALGISTVSVSRALSGQGGVSEELRKKILEKANEMGYSRIKKDGRYNILVLHKKPYAKDNSNFSYMLQGIEKALQNADMDYSMEFVDKNALDNLSFPFKISKGANFDGAILIGSFNNEYADFINKKVKNLIFCRGYAPNRNYDCVFYNYNNAGYTQCQYLIKNGHKNIGFLGNKKLFRNREKLLGMSIALEDNNLPLIPEYIFDTEEDYQSKLEELIKSGRMPTGIICEYDFTAIELIKTLYKKNIKVPDDISVIGSGNTEISLLSIPALTTLDLNIEYTCEAAVSLLCRRIHNPKKPCESISVSCVLIERESVKNLNEETAI